MENRADFVLELQNADGTPADEPDCRVEFLRLDQQVILKADHLQFPPSHRFTVPAFPQGRNLRCFISPFNYQAVQSEFFTLDDGETRTLPVRMLRDPNAWQPEFSRWSGLGAAFDGLKKTIENKLLKVKHQPDVGVVTAAVYDNIALKPVVLAKMAMLNLFAVLTSEKDPVSNQPWFNHVQQVLVIDQERLVARVSSDLYESVDTIRNGVRRFKGFSRADSSLHTDNFPSEFTLDLDRIISVKSVYGEGNVQLTVVPASNADGKCHLLDCDMDEHHNLFLHFTDLIKHAIAGGTHPVEIHDYIVQQLAVDLGYQLRPLRAGQTSAATA
jgi:hypothetical protein